MWRRFKRMVQSNLGRLTDLGGGGSGLTGDLEREVKGMDRKLPELDKNLALFKGEITFTEEKLRKLKGREQELEALTRAADARGSGQASKYGLELEQVRLERAQHERNLVTARVALERAQELKRAFVAERDRKLMEVRERQRALLELQKDDMKAELGHLHDELDLPAGESASRSEPRAVADDDAARRKTVGPPSEAVPEVQPLTQSRAAKTIGPVAAAPVAPEPAEPPAPAAAPLKIKVRPVEPEPKPIEPQQAEKAPTGSFPVQAAAAPSPAVVGGAAEPDLVVELERLARLREQGVLTEEELEQAKRRLLGSGAGS
jgi:phage shock protein A